MLVICVRKNQQQSPWHTKASAISQQAQKGMLHMNTKGTTLEQRKLGGVALNGMVISVNELPDGKADSVIEDVSKELRKLREVAHSVGLPNADSINWSLIASSTSDSAATQKRFNKLMEKGLDKSLVKTQLLSENFCAMHLGVNLRKTFIADSKPEQCAQSNSSKEYHQM